MDSLYSHIRRFSIMTIDEIDDIVEGFDRVQIGVALSQPRAHYIIRKLLTITRAVICLQAVSDPGAQIPLGLELESSLEEMIEHGGIRRTSEDREMEEEDEAAEASGDSDSHQPPDQASDGPRSTPPSPCPSGQNGGDSSHPN